MSIPRRGYSGRRRWLSGWAWRYGVTALFLSTYGVAVGLPKLGDNGHWSPVTFFSYGWIR